jgi:hypothetical protein
MMENCCYDRTETDAAEHGPGGLFGELLHAECGYLHDLRQHKLTDFYEDRWRIRTRSLATAISTRPTDSARSRSG